MSRRLNLPTEPRHQTLLPRERIDAVGWVWWPATGQLIAPWPRGPIDWRDETTLLSVLARCDTITDNRPVWILPDPNREPVLVEAVDLRSWLMNWSRDRACFVTRRRAA